MDEPTRDAQDEYQPQVADLAAVLSFAHETITNDAIWAVAWQAILAKGDVLKAEDEEKLRGQLHNAADFYGSAVSGYVQIAPVLEFVRRMGSGGLGDGLAAVLREAGANVVEIGEPGDGEIQLPGDARNYL